MGDVFVITRNSLAVSLEYSSLTLYILEREYYLFVLTTLNIHTIQIKIQLNSQFEIKHKNEI